MGTPISIGARVDFTDQSKLLPKIVLLDTNILINAMPVAKLPPSQQTSHGTRQLIADTRMFFNRLKRSTNTVNLVSQLSITEYFHYVTGVKIKAFTGRSDFVKDYKNNPDLIALAGVEGTLQNFLNGLKSAGILIVAPEDLKPSNSTIMPLEVQTKNYMAQLNMLSNDAYILAIADRLGVKDIVSADRDFLRARNAGFNIYTSPNLR